LTGSILDPFFLPRGDGGGAGGENVDEEQDDPMEWIYTMADRLLDDYVWPATKIVTVGVVVVFVFKVFLGGRGTHPGVEGGHQ